MNCISSACHRLASAKRCTRMQRQQPPALCASLTAQRPASRLPPPPLRPQQGISTQDEARRRTQAAEKCRKTTRTLRGRQRRRRRRLLLLEHVLLQDEGRLLAAGGAGWQHWPRLLSRVQHCNTTQQASPGVRLTCRHAARPTRRQTAGPSEPHLRHRVDQPHLRLRRHAWRAPGQRRRGGKRQHRQAAA